jgi:hypothetical protein
MDEDRSWMYSCWAKEGDYTDEWMDKTTTFLDHTFTHRTSTCCNIPRLNRINSILIPLSCNFFSGSPSAKNSGVKRAWPGAILGWVTDREVFLGGQSEDKSAQKRQGLVCRARL